MPLYFWSRNKHENDILNLIQTWQKRKISTEKLLQLEKIVGKYEDETANE